jgi:FtsZ-interacting cell division protein ZipA
MNINSNILLIIIVIIIVIVVIYFMREGKSYQGYQNVTNKKKRNNKDELEELLSDYNVSPVDYMSNNYQKTDEESSDCFIYNKKKYIKKTPNDIKKQFNVEELLPQEVEKEWFDIEPLQDTKNIDSTHLIHPQWNLGRNTIMSSLKNATHDIRGDIPNPRINVSPWNNSTIEPDTNLKGFCK